MLHQPKIVSLLPSATETLTLLGLESQIVGRSHACDFPQSILTIPAVTSPRLDPSASSKVIHDNVMDLVKNATGVYDIDVEMLQKLKPDFIITQDQCEVCAVNKSDLEKALESVLDHKVEIISLSPMSFDDVLNDMSTLGKLFNKVAVAEEYVNNFKEEIRIMAHRHKLDKFKPEVVCVEWLDPYMVSGNWIPEMVEIAGGINMIGKKNEHSPWTTWEEIAKADPDKLIFMPCGFSMEQTVSELDEIANTEAWKKLRAVRTGNVFITDGNNFFNRPGPRIRESVEILAEIIQPELFLFGHAGVNFVQIEK